MEKRPIAPNAPYVPHPSQIIHQDPSQNEPPPSYQNLYNVPQPHQQQPQQPPVNYHQQVPQSHIGFQVPITQQPQSVHTQNGHRPRVGTNPVSLVCPSCSKRVTTNIKYENNIITHGLSLVLCLMLCWCCCWIPYYTNSCKNNVHYCPDCGAYISKYNNLRNFKV